MAMSRKEREAVKRLQGDLQIQRQLTVETQRALEKERQKVSRLQGRIEELQRSCDQAILEAGLHRETVTAVRANMALEEGARSLLAQQIAALDATWLGRFALWRARRRVRALAAEHPVSTEGVS